MALKALFVLFTLFSPPFAFAQNLKVEAKREFDRCMEETKVAREQCRFGGCGNIAGSCYDRQLNVISSATDSSAQKIDAGRCKQAEISASDEIESLNSKLKQLAPFDNTWSGYEMQVEVALLKNSVMTALARECETKN